MPFPSRRLLTSRWVADTALEAGKAYDYNLYLEPTVYTLQEGHVLKLAIIARDGCRIDDDDAGAQAPSWEELGTYSFAVDDSSVEVSLPVAES